MPHGRRGLVDFLPENVTSFQIWRHGEDALNSALAAKQNWDLEVFQFMGIEEIQHKRSSSSVKQGVGG